MKNKICLVIPYYNLGDYLDETMKSVFSQSLKPDEIIIVNDGSTDKKSIEALEKYKNHSDKRIKVYDKKNEGLPATRNYAIERTECEFICCIDADDKYSKDFLKKSMNVLEKNKKLGFVTGWFQPFGEVSGKSTIVQVNKDSNLLMFKNMPFVASLFRRKAWEAVKGYDEKMKNGYQDWDFWFSIVEAGFDWEVIPEVLFFYRVRGDSMLRGTVKKDEANYDYILNKHKKFIKTLDATELMKSARKLIIDYDLIINNLNIENKKLKEKMENSRALRIASKFKRFRR